jgi:ureidoacrylate peracid hydrolase
MTEKQSIKLNCRYYRHYPTSQPKGYAEEELALELDNTVFLVVDVYGLGFDEDGKMGDVDEFYKEYVEADRDIVINHIKPAKVAAKKMGLPVVYLTNYLAPSTTENNEWRNMSIRTCGLDVLEVWQEPNDVLAFSQIIAPEEGDYLIKKQHYSGFFETHLESLLKELGARNLVTVGFDSMICLHGTVLDALYRNYRVIVLRDCVGTLEHVETKKEGWANWLAIRFIESNVGYTSTSHGFIQACQEAANEG